MHFVCGLSIKEIARSTGRDRNTVRRALRATSRRAIGGHRAVEAGSVQRRDAPVAARGPQAGRPARSEAHRAAGLRGIQDGRRRLPARRADPGRAGAADVPAHGLSAGRDLPISLLERAGNLSGSSTSGRRSAIWALVERALTEADELFQRALALVEQKEGSVEPPYVTGNRALVALEKPITPPRQLASPNTHHLSQDLPAKKQVDKLRAVGGVNAPRAPPNRRRPEGLIRTARAPEHPRSSTGVLRQQRSCPPRVTGTWRSGRRRCAGCLVSG